MKNKKGFTLVELLSVVILLIVIVTIALTNLSSVFDHGKDKALLDEVKVMSEGAINLYEDERMNKDYQRDLFASSITNKRCYSVRSLIGGYVNKADKNYSGSVEVCYGDNCLYKTKVWLTDGEKYFDGIVSDDTISLQDITDTKTSLYFNSCNMDVSNIQNEFLYDYTGKEEIFTVPITGTYSFEGWGAQGGDAYVLTGPCGTGPVLQTSGLGSYSYIEVDLDAGTQIYLNVGGQGTYYTHHDKAVETRLPGGYNGGGYADYRHGGGGGATTISLKSGRINDQTPNDILLVAGGGGGGNYEPGAGCHDGYNTGRHAGGHCTQGNVYNNWKYCNGEGVYGFQEDLPSRGGGYNTSVGNSNYGGTGFIGNPLTRNGVMVCLAPEGDQCTETSDPYTHTVRIYDSSAEPIAMKAKEGNGFIKITKISSSNS